MSKRGMLKTAVFCREGHREESMGRRKEGNVENLEPFIIVWAMVTNGSLRVPRRPKADVGDTDAKHGCADARQLLLPFHNSACVPHSLCAVTQSSRYSIICPMVMFFPREWTVEFIFRFLIFSTSEKRAPWKSDVMQAILLNSVFLKNCYICREFSEKIRAYL